MASLEEVLYMVDLNKRYPFDEAQKKEIIAIAEQFGDNIPVICIDGIVYEFNNNRELLEAYEKAEDRRYLMGGKALAWKKMLKYLDAAEVCQKKARDNNSDARKLYVHMMHNNLREAAVINNKYFHLKEYGYKNGELYKMYYRHGRWL